MNNDENDGKGKRANLRTRNPKLSPDLNNVPPNRSRHRQVHLRTQAVPPVCQLKLRVTLDGQPVFRDAAFRPQNVRDAEHHGKLGRCVLVRNLPQRRSNSRVQLAFVSVGRGD